MLDEKLKSYLVQSLPDQADWVKKLEAEAIVDRIPIMDALGMDFLMQLIRLAQPKRILEIGTAIGYSALRMLDAAQQAKITTIERDEKRYAQAIVNIAEQNKQAEIDVILGDAETVMQDLLNAGETFDFIFIDAAKGHYKAYFELADALLTDGGVIVSDNVLFRGYVAEMGEMEPRFEKIVAKLRSYNEWLVALPNYQTSITPIGDGIAISKRLSN